MQWHDLLGAVLMDFFEGTPYSVEPEVDLSLEKRWLDVVVVRKQKGKLDRALPDGFAPLAKHNLISFKSHQDTFDSWAALELIGHYVNYRKQVSPSTDELLPDEDFRLIGIAARFPQNLAREMTLEEQGRGVYDITCGPVRIRLLIIRSLEDEPQNALLKLFSPVPRQIEFACQEYQRHSARTSGILDQLIRKYQEEDPEMASKALEIYQELQRGPSPKDRLKGLTPKQVLEVMPLDEILSAASADEIESYLRKTKAAKTPKARTRKPHK